MPRPIIEVIFSHKNNPLKVICIIDSGADFSTLPIDMAVSLGINLDELKKSRKPTECACGNVLDHHHFPVTVEIGGHIIQTTCSFVPSKSPITPLLGRKDIFDYFHVVFDKGQKQGSLRTD